MKAVGYDKADAGVHGPEVEMEDANGGIRNGNAGVRDGNAGV